MNMCILMTMNIYITKENEDYLKALPTEQSMSGLINDLLNDVRNISAPLSKEKVKEIFSPRVKPDLIPTIDATPKTPQTLVRPPRLDNGLCKIHGLPLDARGRCLQKGCKYS